MSTAIILGLALVSLAVGAALLPLRFALLAFVGLLHINLAGPTFESASSIEWTNALRVLVVPGILWFRTRRHRVPRVRRFRIAFAAWVGMIVYALAATWWSPFPLSGFKLVAFLAGYLFLFCLARQLWESRAIDNGFLSAFVGIGVVLAFVQMKWFQNEFGTSEARFTSFASPQFFAITMAAAGVLILSVRGNLVSRSVFACLAFIAVLLSGSRVVLIALLTGVLLLAFARVLRVSRFRVRPGTLTASLISTSVSAALLLVLASSNGMTGGITRVKDAQAAIGTGGRRLPGTLEWRLGLYGETIGVMADRPWGEAIAGSGTSSGGEIALGLFPHSYSSFAIDSNRALHNEYLRVALEWGLIGSIMFALIFWCLVLVPVPLAWKTLDPPPLFAGSLVALVLLTENVLAGTNSPAGFALALLLARPQSVGKGSRGAYSEESLISFSGPSPRSLTTSVAR